MVDMRWAKHFTADEAAEIESCVARAGEYTTVAGAHMHRIAIIARMVGLLDALVSADDPVLPEECVPIVSL